jgi:predicted DNA-binding antitoxin AbrB/MazE fold protein
MTQRIRAIYHDGQLRLLEPVNLAEGAEVTVSITLPMSEDEVMRQALGDSVQWHDPDYDDNAWVEDMADEIDRAFQGEPPLSQIIIEDRGE